MTGIGRAGGRRVLTTMTGAATAVCLLVAGQGAVGAAAAELRPRAPGRVGASQAAPLPAPSGRSVAAASQVRASASSPWLNDCHDDSVGLGLITPELVAACMVVWRDDPDTPTYDDSRDLYVEGYTDGPSSATLSAYVLFDTDGDVIENYVVDAPATPAPNTFYGTAIQRVQGGTLVATGRVAGWARVTKAVVGFDGYLVVLDWRALGLTKARFAMGSWLDADNWTEVPEAFTGGLITLPKAVPPSAPRSVTALAGDTRATVRWARPAQPGSSPITRYTVTSLPGGRMCVTAATTCVVGGLRNGQAYRFQVRAQSLAGASPLSAASAAVVPRPYVRIKISTRSKASKLRVDVDPNKGKGYWSFIVQRRSALGTWAAFSGPYKTKGSKETRTVNPPKGTYRVVVAAKYGYQATTSSAVTLRK